MNLVNAASLADAFRERRVTEAEKYKYLLVSLILSYLLGQESFLASRLTYGRIIYFALALTISVIGLHRCYKTNEAGDNTDFIARFTCLSVPITIWTYIGYAVLYYGTYMVFVSTQGLDTAKALFRGTNPIQVICGILVLLTYFFLLHKFIARANSFTTESN